MDTFQVSHDPSEILICWFDAQEIFLIIIKVENSCATINCAETMMLFKDALKNSKFKRTSIN